MENAAPSPAPPAPPAVAPPARARPVTRIALGLFVLVPATMLAVGVSDGWDRWIGSRSQQTTDDAYLQADFTPLSAHVSGYVRSVPVGDFARVKAGQTLVDLVDDDYRAKVAQAEANVGAIQAMVQTLAAQAELQKANIHAAEAAATATDALLVRDRLEATRQHTLLKQGLAGTQQLVDRADADERQAAATLEQNKAQIVAQRQQVAVIESQIKQQQANLAAARAALDLARIDLSYTRITAPVDGMVGQRLVHPGQYVSVGTQVIALVPLPDVWVVANYKETQMTRIRVGQPATVTVDAFPGTVLKGKVNSWSPASGAQFSLLPPDNATGNFTKVVQRIPVKITLDLDDKIGSLLRPGMSVEATITTENAYDAATP